MGTRLVTYVNDGLMTQRRLEALSQHPQAQSWIDAWRREQQMIPCQLTGFAIPRSLASDALDSSSGPNPRPDRRTRRNAWMTSHRSIPSSRATGPSRRAIWTPAPETGSGREPILRVVRDDARDLVCLAAAFGRSLPSRTIALHMRLLDVFPELARLGAQPLDLQEALRTQRGVDLTFTELALLLGVERRAGMGGRGAMRPASPCRP